MIVGIPKEKDPREKRVAIVPESAKKLIGYGLNVLVEAGAAVEASLSDADYEQVGAQIVDAKTLYSKSQIIMKVQKPSQEEIELMSQNSCLICMLQPFSSPQTIKALAQKRITSFSLELMPRISRAQSMDILTSMSTVAGYKAVILAADYLPRFFPLLMTAAGSITPARVFVIGAGVAGLQAIATAKRLGAVVRAYDTRPVVKEQVESLGATFVEIELGVQEAETAGGYAKALSEEVEQKERELVSEEVAQADVVITTAQVPGKRAPLLITENAVMKMREGSVIVDLAAETGGNCVLTKPGEIVKVGPATIIGLINLPSTMPYQSSQLFSRNLVNFAALIVSSGELNINLDDEIIKGTLVTYNGEIVNPTVKQTVEGI
jgi:NAD(P) transhydrogenase subunit alpha